MIRCGLALLLLLSACASTPPPRREFVAADFVGTWVDRDRRPGNHAERVFRADGTYCESVAEGGTPVILRGRWEPDSPGYLLIDEESSTDPAHRIHPGSRLIYTAHFEDDDVLVLGFICSHCEVAWPFDRAPAPRPGSGCDG